MTGPGFEPRSPGPLANTLPTWPMSRSCITILLSNILFICVYINKIIFVFVYYILFCKNSSETFIKAVFLKWSNLANNVISSPIYNWTMILWEVHSCRTLYFYRPNSWFNKDNCKMLIRILHSFLNRNIHVIVKCRYNGNPKNSLTVKY